MEEFNEFVYIPRPSQFILVEPDYNSLSHTSTKETTREKICLVLRVIGYVLLGFLVLAMIVVSIWGIIHWPWMIVFFFAGLLFSART